MDKSVFKFPSGRKYRNQNRARKPLVNANDKNIHSSKPRTSNRRLLTILMKRYDQMVRRRFGDDIDQRVNLNQLLLDCFHYDLNLIMGLQIPYTHLDELVQSEQSSEKQSNQSDNDGVEEIDGVVEE